MFSSRIVPGDLIDILKKQKRVTKLVVEEYCEMYAEVNNDNIELGKVKDKIKEVMLKNKQKVIALNGVPFKLEMQVNPTKKVDRDSIIEEIASAMFGADFKKNKKFKDIVRRNTKRETVVKLCEPKPNPKYKSKGVKHAA